MNEHEIRGASLLFVFCPENHVFTVHLIDLGSIIPLSISPEGYDNVSRDTGLILGVTSIMA